jgi:hypothetical protein
MMGEKELPGPGEQLINLSKTTLDVVKDIFRDIKASESVVIQRNKTCKECEDYIPNQDRCSVCGCYLKVKTLLQVAKCPRNKWEN